MEIIIAKEEIIPKLVPGSKCLITIMNFLLIKFFIDIYLMYISIFYSYFYQIDIYCLLDILLNKDFFEVKTSLAALYTFL